jgi:phosphate/sulfate permease
MLDEFYQGLERKRKAARRGKILVWWILMPIAAILAAYRVWQLLTGRI